MHSCTVTRASISAPCAHCDPDGEEKARACDEAIEIIGRHLVDDKLEAPRKPSAAAGSLDSANRPPGNEDWAALGSEGVDLQLSGLFALVAPAFVTERARTCMPSQTRELRDQSAPLRSRPWSAGS